jgi:hypothetical protein
MSTSSQKEDRLLAMLRSLNGSVYLTCRVSNFTNARFARPNVAHGERAWLIALAGFRSRPHRSAGTPNTLDLSPLPFTLTAQEGRVFSNLATANPAL